jgi:hypothetical protein
MRILIGHTHVGQVFGELWVDQWVKRLSTDKVQVSSFSL